MIKYTLLLTLFFGISTFAQDEKKTYLKEENSPVYFMDSLNVAETDLLKYDNKEIALITVYKDQNAIDIIGNEGKDGLVYIETIAFVRERYRRYFSSKSSKYAEIAPSVEAAQKIQYIVNEKVLGKDFEKTLFKIDDNTFKGMTVIDKETLKGKYGVSDKEYGVILAADIAEE